MFFKKINNVEKKEPSKEDNSYLIDSDNRFKKEQIGKIAIGVGPFMIGVNVSFLQNVLEKARKNLLEHQTKQQEDVEKYFKFDESIKIKSFYRNPDAKGELDMVKEIGNISLEKNKIILLLNGIVNPQDIVQSKPHLTRVAMALMRLHLKNIKQYGVNLDKLLSGDSISKYIINTIEKVQKDVFEEKPCTVLIVRNAASKDLLDVIKVGGENTTLVVGGHGDFGSLTMTDGIVLGKDIPAPQSKLKAFVQHTCASKKDKQQEEIGKTFSKKTFGWDRGTNPVDFIEDPLPKRSEFNE